MIYDNFWIVGDIWLSTLLPFKCFIIRVSKFAKCRGGSRSFERRFIYIKGWGFALLILSRFS